MIEEQTRNFLNDILITIPLARASGTADEYLDALMQGILYFPVFPGWPSPIDEWLNEAEHLSLQMSDDESRSLVMIRRAGVMMRRLELDRALMELDRAEPLCLVTPVRCRYMQSITRARVYTRLHEFDRAQHYLSEAAPDQELLPFSFVARGELLLEMNQVASAKSTLEQALDHLHFELIEERVQTIQCLSFAAISEADSRQALSYFDQARQILRGAGIWSEVMQMDMVIGSLKLSQGDIGAAEAMFNEALEICERYPQPAIEAALRLGMARLRAATGKVESAITEALNAAKLFASAGNTLGFVGVVSYLHALYLQDRNYVEAYRSLATGLGIAKQLKLPVAESFLRAQVNKMRDETLGPAKFDEMVRKMIDQMKQQRESRPTDSSG